MDITQETILSVLIENNGRVKNSDILNKFKDSLNCSDPVEKKQNRGLFKTFVNNVAVVKEIDDVKYIVIKKRYQHMLKDNQDNDTEIKEQVSEPRPETYAPEEGTGHNKQLQDVEGDNSTSTQLQDVEGENSELHKLSEPVSSTKQRDSVVEQALERSKSVDFKPKRALNFTFIEKLNDNSNAQGGAVFPGKTGTSTYKPFALPLRMAPSESNFHPCNTKSAKDQFGTIGKHTDVHSSPKCKRRPVESGMSGSPQLRRHCKNTKPAEEPRFTDTVPLEPAEHEWMVKSAAGHWSQVYGLLLQDAQLSEKRDFISGFTALHWAAKCGNSDMIYKIIDVSRENGKDVDVNAKTFCGYTPLHIAALHDQEYVMILLVRDFGADSTIRDNSGKRAYHYLHKAVSAEVRELLGQPRLIQHHHQMDVPQDRDEMEHLKHSNTISRLFQGHPHPGHKKKHKHRSAFLSLAEESEKDDPTSIQKLFSDVFT
ncbi:ankyrin repeat domain-containing protein SOWAHA [Chanos chanos]|uniref:Ankyrin repeat domain-containing protein SOWAHA n=1 Tax=Chanos chanos TaxID=29144 RepID=A0A6J2WZI3_CHACN|nr:ankyrin repeat domain-containing protein SOWAHA-like [Chanos chanos]